MRLKIVGMACVSVAAALLVIPAAASAEGTATIEAAPMVKLESWEEGDTNNGTHVRDGLSNHGWNQYWKLKLKAGELLIINWQTAAPVLTFMSILPIGTSDFTVANKRVLAHKFLAGTTRAQLRWKVPSSGIYPLNFRSQSREGVAYAFNARVKPGRPLR